MAYPWPTRRFVPAPYFTSPQGVGGFLPHALGHVSFSGLVSQRWRTVRGSLSVIFPFFFSEEASKLSMGSFKMTTIFLEQKCFQDFEALFRWRSRVDCAIHRLPTIS